MNYHINEDEMKLLAHLHEHAPGYGSDYPFDPSEVQNALRLDDRGFHRAASYLEQLGLVGIKSELAESFEDSQLFLFGIWLTGMGANFMRTLENAPGVRRKVTAAVVSKVWPAGDDAIVEVASQQVTDLARHRGMIP
ncbi:MAG TPA: hypothetical protein VGR35_23700 [Tepidisphaeraceae bacterium]|nr:hypothetical protein [Tepidisphaeraceae bacterium]